MSVSCVINLKKRPIASNDYILSMHIVNFLTKQPIYKIQCSGGHGRRPAEGRDAAKAMGGNINYFLIVNGFTINCNGVQGNGMIPPKSASASHPRTWRSKRRRKEEV